MGQNTYIRIRPTVTNSPLWKIVLLQHGIEKYSKREKHMYIGIQPVMLNKFNWLTNSTGNMCSGWNTVRIDKSKELEEREKGQWAATSGNTSRFKDILQFEKKNHQASFRRVTQIQKIVRSENLSAHNLTGSLQEKYIWFMLYQCHNLLVV